MVLLVHVLEWLAAQFPSRALQRCSGVAELTRFITPLTHCFLHFKRTPELNSAPLVPDTFVHVKWVPCHNGMASPDVIDGRNVFQVLTVKGKVKEGL
jgi:hypothetical protein